MENLETVSTPAAAPCRHRGPSVPRLTLPEVGFVRLETVLYHFPVSRSHWLKGVRDGIYPKAIKLTKRLNAWKVEDIRHLIDIAEYMERPRPKTPGVGRPLGSRNGDPQAEAQT